MDPISSTPEFPKNATQPEFETSDKFPLSNGEASDIADHSGPDYNSDVNFYLHEEEPEDDEDFGIVMHDKAEVVATAIVEHGLPSPPDGGWGWVIVAASFFCFVVIDGTTSSFGILLPNIVATFQKDNPSIGRSEVAWAGSLLSGFSLCIGPIVSALTNKFGCRRICIIGALISAVGFIGASYSPNLAVLLLTYGLIGGIGVGFLYLPAIVCVGYYFESKRALATGIALAGSGIGAIVFAPVITALSDIADWRIVCLGFGGLAFSLSLAGAMMRPLEITIETIDEKQTPLLQRMAHDKKQKLDKASVCGSDYFMVQLPDGSMEKRPKMSFNIDPGVHSVLYLDQLATNLENVNPMNPLTSNIDILPTITELKPNNTQDTSPDESIESKEGDEHRENKRLNPTGNQTGRRVLQKQMSLQNQFRDGRPPSSLPIRVENVGSFRSRVRTISQTTHEDSPQHIPHRRERRHSDGYHSPNSPTKSGLSPTKAVDFPVDKMVPHEVVKRPSLSRPTRQLTRDGSSFASKDSEPLFSYDAMMSSREAGLADGVTGATPRDRNFSIKAIPSVTSFGVRKNSFESQFKSSISTMRDSRRDIFDDDYKFLISTSGTDHSTSGASPFVRKLSRKSTDAAAADPTKFIIRPMSRKDLFYSGSIQNLPEYQSQNLSGYHQSIINIAKKVADEESGESGKKPQLICPCLVNKSGAFKQALAQMMDFSLLKNPVFVTIAVSAVFGMLGFFVPMVYVIDFSVNQGIEADRAAYFISIIGVTSTIGRIGFGLLSDRPWVNTLLVYNSCILTMGLSTFVLPLCFDYYLIAFLYTCFGTALSGFISLSSIILVDLLGLENLTNAFGLLIFFRGFSSVLGTPLSGAIFDATQSFDIPFYLAGIFLIIAALISFMIPCISKFAPPKPILEPRKQSLIGPLEDIIEETIEYVSEPSVSSNASAGGGEKHLDEDKIVEEDNEEMVDDGSNKQDKGEHQNDLSV